MSKVSQSEYAPAGHIRQSYDVSRSTLRAWAEAGKVAVLRANGTGKRLYKLVDVEHVLGVKPTEKEMGRRNVCYARVSSQHQRGDLERQITFLQQHYPKHEIYSDIGSGLNFKRPHFVALLDAVHAKTIGEIVVTDKDRLCRFGADLVHWLLEKTGTELVVHSDAMERPASDEPDYNHELSDDIISIITFFTARSNGQRAARNRKRRRVDGEDEEAKERKKPRKSSKGSTHASKEDPRLSDA